MVYEGRPRTEVEINDLSVIKKGGTKGIAAVIGETERGVIGESVLIKTWDEFRVSFGEIATEWVTPSDNKFAWLCKRAIDQGATLRVARAEHYTDPTDDTSGTSVKGSVSLGALDVAVFTATEVGEYKLAVTLSDAADGTADEYDIKVELDGFPELTKEYLNMPSVVTATLAADFLQTVKYVTIDPATITLTAAGVAESGYLTGGTYDHDNIVAADYVGNKTVNTGIFVFDNYEDFTRIAVPHLADPLIDIALANYAISGKYTFRSIHRTPTDISGTGAVDYREGTGAYTHTAIDTNLASMFTGDILVKHPYTQVDAVLPATGDLLGIKATRDNKYGEWFSSAGIKYPISDATGVSYNLGVSARSSEWDEVAKAGINAVINHKDFGVVPFDNNTLQKDATLLIHENVSELIVHMVRTIKPITESMLFEPNDLETWRAIYRRVTPFLDQLVTGRAIWSDYLYQGDQDIDVITDAVINSTANVDAGIYKFKIAFKPIVALKWIHLVFEVSNSGTDLTEVNI